MLTIMTSCPAVPPERKIARHGELPLPAPPRRPTLWLLGSAAALGGVCFPAPILFGLLTGVLPGIPVVTWVLPVFLKIDPRAWFVAWPAGIVGTYLLWCAPLFKGVGRIPWHTTVAFVVLAILQSYWLANNWRDGLVEHGVRSLWMCVVLAAAFSIGLAAMWIDNRRTRRFHTNVLFHWLMFVWIFCGAFPAMGDFTL